MNEFRNHLRKNGIEFDKDPLNMIQKCKQVTPRNIDQIISKCYKSVETIREEILLLQRTVHLIPFISKLHIPHYLQQNKKDVQLNILNPSVLSLDYITPSFTQHSSILLTYLHTNPEIFCKLVLSRIGKSDFSYLVNSVVPSVYGFFVSQEHVEEAFVFFVYVVKNAKPNIASMILRPFFHSLHTFRFIEHVMSDFSKKVISDKKFDNSQKDNSAINNFANILAACITESCYLLPSQILVILHLTITQKWKSSDLNRLFIDEFFMPMSLCWCDSSPCSKFVPLIEKIISCVSANESLMKQIFSVTLSINSLVDIPQYFKPFKQQFVLYLLTVSDILCIMRYLKEITELPFSVSGISCNNFSPDQYMKPFLVKVFPKGTKEHKLKYSKLIFSSSEYDSAEFEQNPRFERLYREMRSRLPSDITVFESLQKVTNQSDEFYEYSMLHSLYDIEKQQQNFELLLWFLLHKQILENERKLAMRFNECCLQKVIEKEVKSVMTAEIDLKRCFDVVCKSFSNPFVFRSIFLSLIEPLFYKMYDDNRERFSIITQWYVSYCTKRMSSLDSSSIEKFSGYKQTLFWESVELFRSIERVPAKWKFDVIINGTKQISMISENSEENDSLLDICFVLSEMREIPVYFLILNSLIVENKIAQFIVNDEIMYEWLRIQRYILNLLTHEEKVHNVYSELQNELLRTKSN